MQRMLFRIVLKHDGRHRILRLPRLHSGHLLLGLDCLCVLPLRRRRILHRAERHCVLDMSGVCDGDVLVCVWCKQLSVVRHVRCRPVRDRVRRHRIGRVPRVRSRHLLHRAGRDIVDHVSGLCAGQLLVQLRNGLCVHWAMSTRAVLGCHVGRHLVGRLPTVRPGRLLVCVRVGQHVSGRVSSRHLLGGERSDLAHELPQLRGGQLLVGVRLPQRVCRPLRAWTVRHGERPHLVCRLRELCGGQLLVCVRAIQRVRGALPRRRVRHRGRSHHLVHVRAVHNLVHVFATRPPATPPSTGLRRSSLSRAA